MDHQVIAGAIEGVADVQPVEHDRPLGAALTGLYRGATVHQADIVLPLFVQNVGFGIQQDFMEAIEPFNAQRQHRQGKQQGDARLHQRGDSELLQRDQALLADHLSRQGDELPLLVVAQRRQQRDRAGLRPGITVLLGRELCAPRPLNHDGFRSSLYGL